VVRKREGKRRRFERPTLNPDKSGFNKKKLRNQKTEEWIALYLTNTIA